MTSRTRPGRDDAGTGTDTTRRERDASAPARGGSPAREAGRPATLAASAGADPSLAWLLQQCDRTLADGRLDEAVPLLERALALAREPGARAELHLTLGEILRQREEWTRSVAQLRAAADLAPLRADAWYELGLAHAHVENARAAADALRRAHALAPADAEVMRALGVALAAIGEDAEAETLLRRASELAPEDLRVLESLATHCMKVGRFGECGDIMKRATAIAPDNPLVRRLAKETSYLVEMAATGVTPPQPPPRRQIRLVLSGAAGEVERLFVSRMGERGFAPAQVMNACDAWRDFVALRTPRLRNPAEHAAAVEFLIARLDFVDGSAREDVARRYGVDPAVVARLHEDMVDTLEASVFDPRYSTQPHPAEQVGGEADRSGLDADDVFQALLEDEYREYEQAHDQKGATVPRLDREEFEDASVEYGSLLTREMMGLTLGKRERMRKRELERVLLVT